MTKKVAIGISVLVTLIILWAGYYWGIPAAVDFPQRKTFVEQEIFKQSGLKVAFENPELKMGVLPSIKIKADDFKVVNNDGTNALYIKKPYIQIGLIPLIFKKVDIQELRAEDFFANFIYDKNSKLKLGDYPLKLESEFKLNKANLDIDHYKVDMFHERYGEGIGLEGKNLNAVRNTLNIDDMKITGVDAVIKGQVFRVNTQNPRLDLDITLNPSRVESIIPFLPDEKDLIEEMDFVALKKYGFYGDVKGQLNIQGKADTPEIRGNVSISNGYVIKPIPNTKKADINLNFEGKKVVLDITVPAGPTETVYIKGPAELYGKKFADLSITSTKNVSLANAQLVLNPLHEILKFDLGPVPVMTLSGAGNVNIRVKGNRKTPQVWGEFKFHNTTASLNDIKNMTLKNAEGNIIFNDTEMQFTSKKASLNGKPLSLDGTANVKGVLDFKVRANGQNPADLIEIVKSSPMLSEFKKLSEPIKTISGNVDLFMNLTGEITDFNKIEFNKNIFAKGTLKLTGVNVTPNDMPVTVSKINGNINYNNLDGDFDIASNILGAGISTKGSFKDGKLNVKGQINPFNSQTLNLSGGSFELNGSTLKLPSMSGSFKGNPFYVSGIINAFLEKNQVINGEFRMQKLDLSTLNGKILENIDEKLKNVRNLQGTVNINAKMRNNNINADAILNDVNLTYNGIDVKVADTNLALQNNVLNLDKLGIMADGMPVLIDGKISGMNKKPNLKLYVTARPTQEFIDKAFNSKAVYPLKIKGDVNTSARLSGDIDNLNVRSQLTLDDNSQIYYMGSTIGDSQYPVKIALDGIYSPGRMQVSNFRYDKIVSSQSNKPYPVSQLNASGTLAFLPNNNIGFKNFRVKTQVPTDAKIFNIIFRKPTMKQGMFTSDLVINGTAMEPKIYGKMEINSIDMPFFNAAVNDVNLDFKSDTVNITSKGTVLDNFVKFNAVMKNKLNPPYVIESANLNMANLDINKITDMLRDFETESLRSKAGSSSAKPFDLSQLVINKAEITADKVKVRNINANNFSAKLNVNEKMIANIDNFHFNIANGTVNGDMKYNLLSRAANLNIHMNNADALIMTEALFDLKGQIYGSMTGDAQLVCNGKTYETCLQTLSGSGNFKVANGKMPKLGSLEYLLKAGNLVKGGFSGLSLNSLIDLVTPLKTGEFESISGDISLSGGSADKINIYSKGKDLNLYMTGSYNLVNSVANMEIYGAISKNITTIFGKLKNASLNTLFNTIPGIGEEDKALPAAVYKIPNYKGEANNISRVFKADIYGDINGSNYVRSFNWLH